MNYTSTLYSSITVIHIFLLLCLRCSPNTLSCSLVLFVCSAVKFCIFLVTLTCSATAFLVSALYCHEIVM